MNGAIVPRYRYTRLLFEYLFDSFLVAYCKESEAEIPAGGYRHGRNDVGHSLHFFCNDDRRLVGASSVRCQENGKWSDKAPVCKRTFS